MKLKVNEKSAEFTSEKLPKCIRMAVQSPFFKKLQELRVIENFRHVQ